MPSIRQSMIDDQFETRIDGVTIRSCNREKVERIAAEVALSRAMKTRAEESMDAAEQQQTAGDELIDLAPCGVFLGIALLVVVFGVLAYFGW